MGSRNMIGATVHWLIEVDVFAETAHRITRALDARGQPWVRYHDDVSAAELPGCDGPVLFWGSLGAAYGEESMLAGLRSDLRPGAIGDIRRFYCSAYQRELRGVAMVNAHSVFTSVAELVREPARVLTSLGRPACVFVRPDSPLKPFSGRVLNVSDLSLGALDHGFYYDDERLPIVVSDVRTVGREWRLVVGQGQIIAGCEYQASRTGMGAGVPGSVLNVATRVASASWQAAPLYVVDVAEVDGALAVMELNPFSGADLYDCEPDAIVDAASAVAARLYRDTA